MISKKTNTRCEHAEVKQKSKFTFVFPRQVTNTDTLQMTTCKYKDTRSRQAFKHVLQRVMLDLIPVLVFLKPLFEMGLKVGYAGHSLITSAGPFQTFTSDTDSAVCPNVVGLYGTTAPPIGGLVPVHLSAVGLIK